MYKNEKHKEFYEQNLAKCKYKDVYHQALIYTLGINEDTRSHIDEIFDFRKDRIKVESLKSGWVTGSDIRVMRLAFNLYTDNVPEDEIKKYTVSEIFNYDNVRYLAMAVIVRFGG